MKGGPTWPGALDANAVQIILRKSDLGNVDLPRTMLLPDSAANAGSLVPKTSLDHEGAEFESK